MLRRMDHEPAAVVAKQELPDPVDSEEVAKLGERLDISPTIPISGMAAAHGPLAR